jgi:hypothetical protein
MNPNGWLQRGGTDAAALARYAGIDVGTPDIPWPPIAVSVGTDMAAPREAVLL